MEYILGVILAFSTLVVTICLTKLQITIRFIREGKNDLLQTRVRAWFGLIHMKMETSVIQLSEDLSGVIYRTEMASPNKQIDKTKFKVDPKELFQVQQRIHNWAKHIRHFHQTVKKFLKNIHIYQWEWVTQIGTGNAALTGQAVGLGWSIKFLLAGILSHLVTFKQKPRFHVQPFFQESCLNTEIQCMFRIQIGYAILAGIRVLLNLRKKA